jgi:hypothetical protein
MKTTLTRLIKWFVKTWKGRISGIGVTIAILAGIAEISGFSLKDIINQEQANSVSASSSQDILNLQLDAIESNPQTGILKDSMIEANIQTYGRQSPIIISEGDVNMTINSDDEKPTSH